MACCRLFVHHLDAASIAHKRRIELGHPAETIVRCAEEEHCDLIVLAEPKPGAVREWLMRNAGIAVASAASVLVHFAGVPVVIAK